MMAPYVNFGRWIPAEEEYVHWMLVCFQEGILEDCSPGTTLRHYLARNLLCDKMRITKKLKSGKTLAGRRLLSKNFNRTLYVKKRDITANDVETMNTMKLSKLVFETQLKLKRTQQNSTVEKDEQHGNVLTNEPGAKFSIALSLNPQEEDNVAFSGTENETFVGIAKRILS